MNFRNTYQRLSRKYLGRLLTGFDGVSAIAVQRAERRLGVALPLSLREYYLAVGRVRRLNHIHNKLRPAMRLRIEDGHLVFMDENQFVVSWGIRVRDLRLKNPVVWQRNNTPPIQWYSEEKTVPELLESMFDWYSGSGIWPERDEKKAL